MSDQLTANQLCCLLNYCLGLPVISNKRNIMAPEIPAIVVGLWTMKVQRRAEIWVEREMRNAGALPALPKPPRGKHPKVVLELAKWIPPGMKAAFYTRREAA